VDEIQEIINCCPRDCIEWEDDSQPEGHAET
jgi:hypothetical protein